MHIHVGTGSVARTSVTVPIPDFRVFSLQLECFVTMQFFLCGIKLKTGDAKSSFVLQKGLALQRGTFPKLLSPSANQRQLGCAHPQI